VILLCEIPQKINGVLENNKLIKETKLCVHVSLDSKHFDQSLCFDVIKLMTYQVLIFADIVQ